MKDGFTTSRDDASGYADISAASAAAFPSKYPRISGVAPTTSGTMDATETYTNFGTPAVFAASIAVAFASPFPARMSSSLPPMQPTHETTASAPSNAAASASDAAAAARSIATEDDAPGTAAPDLEMDVTSATPAEARRSTTRLPTNPEPPRTTTFFVAV
eukprot:7403-Pelagococcus_subviridis.AAC.7